MAAPQFIRTASGEELVVLTRADYDALLEALAEAEEDAADVALYDARKAETGAALLPPEVSAAIMRGARLLEALRDWRGFTQTRLAEATGLAQGYLSDIERGRRKGTSETLSRIAAALDVPVSWLEG